MRAAESSARAQHGFFLIEALVAILIFSLGILGLVAMAGTAVSAQSDAQYRTEASQFADQIASQIAIGVDRTTPATVASSLAQFQHHATGAATGCAFSGGGANASGAPPAAVAMAAIADRAGNADPLVRGLPGAVSPTHQQVVVDTGTFNRVQITLCWRAPSDTDWRRHTLVTYVN